MEHLPGTSDGRNLRFGSAFAFEFGPGNSAGTKAYIGANGTLTLTPDAGQDALNVTGKIANQTGNLVLRGNSAYVTPDADGGINMGHPSIRWAVYYAVNGIVQTSSREYKEGVTPSTRAWPWRPYATPPPSPSTTWPPPVARSGTTSRTTRSRRKRCCSSASRRRPWRRRPGTSTDSSRRTVDALFLVGEGQTSPGSSVGVFLAALQNIDQRLAALETP